MKTSTGTTYRHYWSSFRRQGLASVIAALSLCQPAAADTALMPLPQTMTISQGSLPIEGGFSAEVSGCADAIAASALARFSKDLTAITGMPDQGPPVPMTVTCRTPDPHLLSLDAKEAYRLDITPDKVTLDADGETGVLRGLATLRQLVARDAHGPVVPLVRIDDSPRFRWRGLMIDTARHFMSIETLKRQIAAMELAKLNVLHLHLSDNEAFRVESRRFPKLATIASHGQYYTQVEIRDLVRYARERGVRIVPEFDMPGHNLALVLAYPELAAVPLKTDDPLIMSKGALNPASEKTYRFLAGLLREMAALFPDHQFHVGGDEVSDAAWKESAEVDKLKASHGLASKTAVEAYFHARVRDILAAAGKSTVGWDEMAEGEQSKDLIIQSWRTSNPVSTATAKGHRVIVSAGYYLDQLRPADTLYAIDPLDPAAFTTMTAEVLARVRQNPVTAAMVSDGLVAKQLPPLTAEQEQLVLGAEAPLWAELVSDEMLDGRLWPRALALAERFWSPATVRDPEDMYARLLPAMDRVRSLGLLDTARRERMTARLAPEAPQVVDRLVGLVAPVRMYAHSRVMVKGPNQRPQELVEPADAASTDGAPARRFRVNVARYLSGDRKAAATLRAELTAWRENEAPFTVVATGRPLLEAVIPTARDIAALGMLGLAALDALEQGKPVPPDQATAGRALLQKLEAFENASKDLTSAGVLKQPPADLIILVAPDVGRLLDAAMAETGK